MMTHEEQIKLNALFIAFLEGQIDQDQIIQLSKLLKGNDDVVRHYVEFICIYVGLCKPSMVDMALSSIGENDDQMNFGQVLWGALAENEKTAPPVSIQKPLKAQPSEIKYIEKLKVIKTKNKISRFSLATAIASSAALILILVYTYLNPKNIRHVVGILSDSVAAEWIDVTGTITAGSDLYTGTLKLLKGYAQITLDCGAMIIVEGPSEVELKTPQNIFLKTGKLVAYVPSEAKGFMIETPSTSMVDLGTEFCVRVDDFGTSQLHVIKGVVVLTVDYNNNDEIKAMEIVTAGNARSVNIGENEIHTIALNEPSFQYRLPSRNLIAYWNFDKDLTNRQGDAAFNGIAVGRACCSQEDVKIGTGALKIDGGGSESDFIVINADVLGQSPLIRTVVCWYKYKDISGDGSHDRNFIWETAPNWSLSFGIRNDKTWVSDDRKHVQWYFDNTMEVAFRNDAAKGPVVDDGNWHHAAVIWNKNNGCVRFYHDGQLWDNVDIPSGMFLKNEQKTFHIGSHRDIDGSRNWDGYIDDMAVYDIELTPNQVKSLFTGLYNGFEINAGNILTIVP